MTDAPAPSAERLSDRAFVEAIAVVVNGFTAERAMVKFMAESLASVNDAYASAEARATAAEAQVREMREMLAKAALCFSALAGDGISTTENGDPADIYFEIGALLGLDANSDTAEWDNDFRATLAATKAEG